ncbi:uncharacterized protein I303_104973 [Kwoniella dejecticola CBS 10117]|uniref:Pentatricopeptide repeat domain-containing protein n=1 Tax=Kwoniella dejecticola CBS 10117 TaxID=1296121 RepID=A0A1A6A3T7_9TREE|nr:uncharacterized protein I303_05582 [Kwoniella dejecticola CBS 10117]OBR84723.1 hypothetical protein I303_05582 [Kwoniella dejecticola CBS 10117]
MPFRARCSPVSLIRRRYAFRGLQRIRPSDLGGSVARAKRNQSYRYNSTSSLFSQFTSFFNRARTPLTPTPQQAASDFLTSISAKDTDSLGSSYNTIITSPNPGETLSQNDLLAAMEFLASSSSLRDLELLRTIFEDLPNRFGYPVNEGHQALLIRGLCNNGLAEDAFVLAQRLDPSSVDWRIILRSASTNSPSVVDRIIPFLQAHSKLDQTDISLILQSLRRSVYSSHSSPGSLSGPSSVRIKLDGLLETVREQSIILEPSTEAELMRLYLSLGELDKANDIVQSWDKANIWSPGLYNAIIELYIARSDRHQVEYTITKMREKGLTAPQKALSFLSTQQLRQSIDSRSSVGFNEIVGSIEFTEKICDVSAGADVWADLIRMYLKEVKSPSSLDVALEVYSEILSRGIEPSAELSRNLIIPLCNSKDQSKLNHAIRIYDHYMSTPAALSKSRERSRFSSIYQYLLAGCSRASPPLIGKAINIITDMRTHKMEINPANLVSLLILLMRSSEDHHSAFNVYSHFYALSPNSLDESSYQAILSTYLQLSWPKSPYPSPELFVTILKDMSKAGYQPSSAILSSLLKTYGFQATKLRRTSRSGSVSTSRSKSKATSSPIDSELEEDGVSLSVDEQLDNLGQSIRDIHTLIKLDPLIDVDIPLLSSLMDAYSRVGAYSECFEVWDELVQRRSRESPEKIRQLYAASINVILDACGWSYSLQRGKKIWAWAKRWDLIWEKKHYDSYVEFLCRNSQFADASNVVLGEMAGGSGTGEEGVGRAMGIKADGDTVRIVLKFGRREADKGNDVRDMIKFVDRLKVEREELYDQLRRDGESEEW